MKYLLNATNVYRVHTVGEVEQLHEELANDPMFQLTNFSYTTKYIKEKGEIVEEYQIVKAKKVFNEEKFPEGHFYVKYGEGIEE